ncbi:MAG: hypothetical protein U5K69_26265 [Balneolaceae bacterium]|nr:hypothetical protein [Balneolaceae bacterium]
MPFESVTVPLTTVLDCDCAYVLCHPINEARKKSKITFENVVMRFRHQNAGDIFLIEKKLVNLDITNGKEEIYYSGLLYNHRQGID